MLRVTVEIDKHGLGIDRETLCAVTIWNDTTGSTELGNYEYAISHDASYEPVPDCVDLALRPELAWRSGTITDFPRRLGSAALLARVMADAFPTQAKTRERR